MKGESRKCAHGVFVVSKEVMYITCVGYKKVIGIDNL